MDAHSGIYMFTNTISGSRYIGSAVNLRLRRNQHMSDLKQNKHRNAHLQSAYNLYGKDAFVYTVLEYVPNRHDLIPTEQRYIDEFCPEYNIARKAGSSLGRRPSSVTKAKVSLANKGKPAWNKGKTSWNKGKPMSKEAKHKMIAAKKGKPTWNKGRKGYKLTPEQKNQSVARRNATIAARKIIKQKSLWDDTPTA